MNLYLEKWKPFDRGKRISIAGSEGNARGQNSTHRTEAPSNHSGFSNNLFAAPLGLVSMSSGAWHGMNKALAAMAAVVLLLLVCGPWFGIEPEELITVLAFGALFYWVLRDPWMALELVAVLVPFVALVGAVMAVHTYWPAMSWPVGILLILSSGVICPMVGDLAWKWIEPRRERMLRRRDD